MSSQANKPVHTLRLSPLKAAIWSNATEVRTFFSVTFSRTYKDAKGEWQESTSFGRDDLLPLAKLADQAHTWISEQPLREG